MASSDKSGAPLGPTIAPQGRTSVDWLRGLRKQRSNDALPAILQDSFFGAAPSSGITGSLNATLGAATASSASRLAIAGEESATLGALISSASARLSIAGQESTTLGALASTAAGALAIAGQESSTLGALTLAGAGTNGQPPVPVPVEGGGGGWFNTPRPKPKRRLSGGGELGGLTVKASGVVTPYDFTAAGVREDEELLLLVG